MAGAPGHVGNTLTLIAVFAGVSEAVSAAALPFIKDPGSQEILLLFVTLFPSALVALFFLTLWISPARLYGPGDFKSDEGYLAAQTTLRISEVYIPTGDAARKLRDFWKPGGSVDEANAKALQEWLSTNDVGTNSIAAFLASEEYRKAREQAVAHFSL
jgi:hypothetical protein